MSPPISACASSAVTLISLIAAVKSFAVVLSDMSPISDSCSLMAPVKVDEAVSSASPPCLASSSLIAAVILVPVVVRDIVPRSASCSLIASARVVAVVFKVWVGST